MKQSAIALLAVMIVVFTASGATLLVPSQYTTIQAGINAASDGDTVLIAAGTYTGTGNKNLDFGGRDIVVMSESGPENCTIDCQGTGQGFYFHTGETGDAKVIGLTIKGGNNTYGGGIRINGSSPTIERCIICNNNASYGGGVYINVGDPGFIHCTITYNTATNGGAMYSTGYADPTIKNCIVASNSSSG